MELISKRGDIFGEDFLKSLNIKKKINSLTINSLIDLREDLELNDSGFNVSNASNGQNKISTNDTSSKLPILAYTECIALESTWEKIIEILEIQTEERPFDLLSRINKLKNIFIFKNLSQNKLMILAKLMKKRKYQRGDIIIQENTIGDEFYLLTKGSVKVTQHNVILREFEEGNCFGEISILNNELRTATVTAIKSVICYVLHKSDFDRLLDREIKENLKIKIALQDTSISINDLYYLKTLGRGRLGQVLMVHNKKNFYALKAIRFKNKQGENLFSGSKLHFISKTLLNEKNIKIHLDHPFISKTVTTIKTEEFLFFLNEYVNGKNFKDYLQERNAKSVKSLDETNFYAACMISMLEYLHKKNICHRDIKPVNMMIDKNGYLKLIDLGTAKVISDFTHTTIGTPHYMAPEVILGQGYSNSCDFWSLGVSIYEIFYGTVPFGKNNYDILEIYKEILHKY